MIKYSKTIIVRSLWRFTSCRLWARTLHPIYIYFAHFCDKKLRGGDYRRQIRAADASSRTSIGRK